MSWDIENELQELEAAHLRRRLRVRDESAALLDFASNDYLGLARSAFLKNALLAGVERWGAGTGASRLVTGTTSAHEELEAALAAFKHKAAALTFSSGYAAAVGTITALVGPGDTVILDKLAHASLIDAARLSGATLRVFPHNHVEKLERLLLTSAPKSRRMLIVTESVFSMDGDTAPLREIVQLKAQHGAWLLLDEAHALGVMGTGGRGLAAAMGLSEGVELHFGTLSKAVGLSGGYVAASRNVIDLLINRARSFIYTTAPSAAIASAATEALRHIGSIAGDELRKRLVGNAARLMQGLGKGPPQPETSAIHPHIVGTEEDAIRLSDTLRSAGIIAPAIRFPTVAKGSARLRITVTAQHRHSDIDTLLEALVAGQNQNGSRPCDRNPS